ncbi:glucosamine-6-phosphate deaminase [Marininema halotolerans]|uniref:Glucosamine-6-phosphate deaminase n=1 Tax=Marininema halotolerans TaxID=1155944 RepID=A0A1I6SVT2_9BACL|nr:glucosamine-6-phosphate deaminase [Marininema halotolerans]SFS81010.1 glucosamine-6-phosphate deaminase [Marininema halotolerans]
MEVLEVANYEEMSMTATRILLNKMNHTQKVTLGLATGATPRGMYQMLVASHQEKGVSFRNVQTVNLDEYVGLERHHPSSYHTYMAMHFFRWIDIDRSHTHLPNGKAEDLTLECFRYEDLIHHMGGVDLQVLGLGRNGHIGFNEPGTSFHARTHVVELARSTRRANARYFAREDEVPSRAITMGIATILESREIVLLASGSGKSEAITRLLEGKIQHQFPATALLEHPKVTMIVDREALIRQ